MNLENQKVEHNKFGIGVITVAKNQEIYIQFEENVGLKSFQYPEVFEKFLKMLDVTVETYVFEELRKKKEREENLLLEEQLKAAKLQEENAKIVPVKRMKSTSRVTKKKVLNY